MQGREASVVADSPRSPSLGTARRHSHRSQRQPPRPHLGRRPKGAPWREPERIATPSQASSSQARTVAEAASVALGSVRQCGISEWAPPMRLFARLDDAQPHVRTEEHCALARATGATRELRRRRRGGYLAVRMKVRCDACWRSGQ